MKIKFELEIDEQVTPINVASAIINEFMGNDNYSFEFNKSSLTELVDYIKVYLKHCEVNIK